MKAPQRRIDVKKERLTFLIEATELPIIAFIPVATAFIGYMTSTIQLSLKSSDLNCDSYHLFLKSTPYNSFIYNYYFAFNTAIQA